MAADQQMAVLLQLNLNGTEVREGGEENASSSSWQDDLLSVNQEASGNEIKKNNVQECIIIDSESEQINRELEFLQKHASEADPGFLQSLLNSQVDNPKRLEVLMCEVLNIPNALQLIQEFRKTAPKAGEKRPNAEAGKQSEEEEEAKRPKTKDTEKYLQQAREMFPEADGLFLISECQQLESEEDFSRFINTVMISGLYPKKEVIECPSSAGTSRADNVLNNSLYRTSVIYSSEDETYDSVLETPRRGRRRKTSYSSDESLVVVSEKRPNNLSPPQIDVIDVASDNTETYEPPDAETLQQIYNDGNLNGNQGMTMDVDESLPVVDDRTWEETTMVEDIDTLLRRKFGETSGVGSRRDDQQAGPSRSVGRLSLPGSSSQDSFAPEKSLAEIIEESRHNRRRSFDSPRAISPGSVDAVRLKSLLRDSSEGVSPTFKPTGNDSEVDEVVADEEYSKAKEEEWLDEQTANLVRIFPNADPSYLRGELAKMNGSSECVNEFVISKLERNDMPTRAEYEKKLEMEELQSRYTKNFSIVEFLKAIPDPWKYFTEENRQCAVYKSHSLCYLKMSFRRHYVRTIVDVFNKNENNLYLSYKELKKEDKKRRCVRRSEFECNQSRPTTINIQFLQEVAFIENEDKIREYLEGEKIERQIKFDEAKRTGSLLECQCCFDSEVMVEDIFYCPKDHAFCKDCVVKSVEVEMGNGRFQFECLANCEERFTLACLQSALKPELFSKVIQAIQMEEVRAAGIEDLVQCPFCNYATIMPPEEKVMTCLNPECLKESCRLCKELNHIPLRCDEVEKSEEVKMRTYIENKMTEALVRTCYKCGKKFVKEDGCNKMTCTCGAKMCYVCRKPVTGYSHFNGQGGTEYHKCPLYSRNDELHIDLVQQVGEQAKAEIMQANPQTKLLHDPTVIMPERTAETTMPGMNRGAALALGLRAIRGINQGRGQAGDNNLERQRIDAVNELHNGNRCHRHRLREAETEEDEDEEDEEDEGEEEEEEQEEGERLPQPPPLRSRRRRHCRAQIIQEIPPGQDALYYCLQYGRNRPEQPYVPVPLLYRPHRDQDYRIHNHHNHRHRHPPG